MLTPRIRLCHVSPTSQAELSAEAMVHFHLHFLHIPPETGPLVKEHFFFFRQGETLHSSLSTWGLNSQTNLQALNIYLGSQGQCQVDLDHLAPADTFTSYSDSSFLQHSIHSPSFSDLTVWTQLSFVNSINTYLIHVSITFSFLNPKALFLCGSS